MQIKSVKSVKSVGVLVKNTPKMSKICLIDSNDSFPIKESWLSICPAMKLQQIRKINIRTRPPISATYALSLSPPLPHNLHWCYIPPSVMFLNQRIHIPFSVFALPTGQNSCYLPIIKGIFFKYLSVRRCKDTTNIWNMLGFNDVS